MTTLGDYDRWTKPCKKCSFANGKLGKESELRCWKCGYRLERDYSDKALKINSKGGGIRWTEKIQLK